MPTKNEIVLRPRFKINLDRTNESALMAFEKAKKEQKEFIVPRIDDNVYIKIPKREQHFWSPQLHLEIMKIENDKCTVFGLFGPNPTVWTLFMFLHFIVAGLFLSFGIWAYSNWSLDNDFAIQLFIALMMIVVWFALYFGGRIGKATGKRQMHLLNNFMNKTLNL